MDKYDILFIWDTVFTWVKEIYSDRKDFVTRYTVAKLDWMRRRYYLLRVRRSAKYNKKNPRFESGVHKAFILKRGTRYMWDMFKPMEKK